MGTTHFKLITTKIQEKNTRLVKYVCVIKLLKYSCNTGTQKAPNSLIPVLGLPSCDGVRVRGYQTSTTDESASVATSASTTLPAISHRQLRSPLLRVTNVCDITTTNSSSKRVCGVCFDRTKGVVVWDSFCLLLSFHTHFGIAHTQIAPIHTHMTGCKHLHTQAAHFLLFCFDVC